MRVQQNISSEVEVNNNRTVTLDLNGHTIDAQGKFRVINVSNGGDLTLTNSLAAGSVTGGGDALFAKVLASSAPFAAGDAEPAE